MTEITWCPVLYDLQSVVSRDSCRGIPRNHSSAALTSHWLEADEHRFGSADTITPTLSCSSRDGDPGVDSVGDDGGRVGR